MATPQISPLQFVPAKFSSEMIDQNNLSRALLTRPEIASTLHYIWGMKYVLGYLTQGLNKTTENYQVIGNEEYRWALMGNLTKTVTVLSAPTVSKPGINISEFKLVLNDRYFSQGDIIKFGTETLARVQAEPEQVGTGYEYRLVLNTNDPNAFLAPADCAVGKEVAWVGSAFEEFSEKGSSKRAFPMWFRNQLTTIRQSWGMSGSAATDVMVLRFKGKDGKPSLLWEHKETYENMLMFNRQKELMAWYGVYNRTPSGEIPMVGANGRPVKTGAGFRAQVANANRRTYTDLTEDYLLDFLLDLQLLSKGAENSNFALVTGSDGIKRFTQTMREALKGAQVVDTTFLTKEGNKGKLFNPNNITSYKGILGSTLNLIYNPIQDDVTLHTEKDPETGRPIESGTFYFSEVGEYDGESNISMITKGADGKNRSMLSWTTAGSTVPRNSSITEGIRSNSLDGFEHHMLSEFGIKVLNPLSCGILERVVV